MDLHGPLDLFGLSHLLRVAELRRSTFGLVLTHPIARGEIQVTDGLVISARVGRSEGERAVATLLSWSGARFTLLPARRGPRTGKESSPRSLLETLLNETETRTVPHLPYVPIQGGLELLDLLGILHIFRENRLAARIEIVRGEGRGEILLGDGSIFMARAGRKEGKEAVESLLGAQGGAVKILPEDSPVESEETWPIDLYLQEVLEREEEGPTDAEMAKNFRTFAAAPLVEQIRLAKRGNQRQRILAASSARDQVALSVVQDRNVTPELAEAMAAKPRVNPTVLRFLAGDHGFRSIYAVSRALVFNPSTPPDSASDLLDRLRDVDLRKLIHDRAQNSEYLRIRARRLLDVRKEKRSF